MKDGGPAFPETEIDFDAGIRHEVYIPGMTMRQYYKAKLVAGFMDKIAIEFAVRDYENDALNFAIKKVYICGRIADAMIAEDEAHAENNSQN